MRCASDSGSATAYALAEVVSVTRDALLHTDVAPALSSVKRLALFADLLSCRTTAEVQ